MLLVIVFLFLILISDGLYLVLTVSHAERYQNFQPIETAMLRYVHIDKNGNSLGKVTFFHSIENNDFFLLVQLYQHEAVFQ